MNDSDLISVPSELYVHRDSLRIVGYDLVRFTRQFAGEEASAVRHEWVDYEYAIHKIESIVEGQIYVVHDGFFCSATDVPRWTKYRVEEERPRGGIGLIKGWFKENLLLSVVAAPYSLALLGLSAVGEHQTKKAQEERAKVLGHLKSMPRFAQPYSRPR
jgi:hypothetical protein